MAATARVKMEVLVPRYKRDRDTIDRNEMFLPLDERDAKSRYRCVYIISSVGFLRIHPFDIITRNIVMHVSEYTLNGAVTFSFARLLLIIA